MKKVNDEIISFAFSFYRTFKSICFDLPEKDELSNFDKRFRIILRKHLMVFASWSILNCVAGLIALLIIKGSVYYFWMMSSIWGIINFAVAIGFFNHTLYRKQRKVSFHERLVVQRHVEKMMWLNICLDVAFVFIGVFMSEYSFTCNVFYTNLWLGFGWAVTMQGIFLLVQDITFLSKYRLNFLKSKHLFET